MFFSKIVFKTKTAKLKLFQTISNMWSLKFFIYCWIICVLRLKEPKVEGLLQNRKNNMKWTLAPSFQLWNLMIKTLWNSEQAKTLSQIHWDKCKRRKLGFASVLLLLMQPVKSILKVFRLNLSCEVFWIKHTV